MNSEKVDQLNIQIKVNASSQAINSQSTFNQFTNS